MKKAFNLKFFVLSALLMLGNVVALATPRPGAGPADGTAVGATIKIGDKIGLVTYRVSGWNSTNDFYTVSITGLDADGLEALAAAQADAGKKVTLRIPVTFEEKFGEERYKYAVTAIADGLVGPTKQSFYGYTEIDTLIFVDGTGYNGVGLDKFTYTVGYKSFYGCTNMKKLQFTENCSSIGQYAFQNTAIKDFLIPKKCATIGEYAFYNCKKLQTVTVQSGNTVMNELGTHVFGNSSLTTLDLRNAEQLWEITGAPFMYNLSIINDMLKVVYVPNNLKDINQAFANCTALTNVINFENTKLGNDANDPAGSPAGGHVEAGAFAGCRSLTRLDIPSCDVFVAPFEGCESLDTISFKAGYNKTIGKTPIANTNLFGTFDTTSLVYSAADQSALKVIEFNGVLNGTINSNAFVGSLGLAKVDFKGKLQSDTHIKAAFTDVTSLTDVIFNGINSDGVANVTIENNAFKNTGISKLDFKGINLQSGNNKNFEIGANAFSDCANLDDIKTGDITVKNTGTFSIAGTAFINNPKVAKVTFGSTTFTGAGTVTIADDAFATGNVGLKDVEFGAINSTNGTTGYASTFTIGGGARVFGDGLNLETVKFGDVDANTFTINDNAFAWNETPATLYALKKVEFGNISSAYGINSTFTIGQKAFYEGKKEAKTVKFGNFFERPNNTNTLGSLTVLINVNAFAADSLKSVEMGNITSIDFDINGTAFQGKNLQKVKIGNINKSTIGVSDFDIAANAFQGGEVANTKKTVEIGNIGDLTGANIGPNAFAAEKLQSVKIGNMAPTSLTIGVSAFSGGILTNVELGNIGAGVTINDLAFANTNITEALTETVKIGDLAAATFADTDADNESRAFQGPQFAGSALNVTINSIAGAATMKSKTFVAPEAADGTATFTVKGNVAATLGVPAAPLNNVFIGAQKYVKGVPVANTTDVWFQGNYNAEFAVADVFTNVNDLKIAVAADGSAKTYNVAGDLKAFQGAKTVTIGDMPTGKSIVANTLGSTDEITAITFLKNVTDANAIKTFNSPFIRKIEFKDVAKTGVKVHAGAVSAGAFQIAVEDALLGAIATDENITVIYREEQTREAEVIFNQTTFSAVNDALRPVTLYTSTWAKANTFEAADVEANEAIPGERAVYRLGFSESIVAPGEPIIAEVSKKEGQQYAYAKLYVPKGTNMLYKVPAEYDATSGKNGIQLYFGRIDNSNGKIYMYSLPVIDDYYWIDATDVDQAFVLRTNTELQPATSITALPVTEEDLATFAAGDPSEYYFFDAALAVQNQLRYNPAEIANQELKNNAEFAGKDVFVMANPETQGFKFAKFNKDYIYPAGHAKEGEYRALNARSLYIVGKSSATNLTVVFEGDEDFENGIEELNAAETETENSGAIYNLQGVRVSKAQKGIYIQNGKKFIVK